MGDVLAGIHSTWEFGTDSVLIRFERGIRTPKLFHVLRERRVPYEALSSIDVSPGGRRGTVALRAVPRSGADPLLEAAGGQLKEATDPYRLLLPAERVEQAERCAAAVRERLGPEAAEASDSLLVAPPQAPLQFKAYDGKAAFDGDAVTFRWFRTGASSAKWKAGNQSFPVEELTGVQWRSPEVLNGHLRLLRLSDPPDGPAEPADQDPAAVVFGLGYGLVHESLPLAAAVLAAVRETDRAAVPAHASGVPAPRQQAAPALRADPADIAERIRHLGELRDAGLVTADEFAEKKSELLAEL